MEQKSKNQNNKIEKTNKKQEQDGVKKKIPDFIKETVSHGPKTQKNLHYRFFFEEF